MSELERTNLEAHVDLCAERYKGLETRLDNVEKAVKDLHSEMRRMHEENMKATQSTNKIMLGAAATVAAGILSTIVVILMS
jgi:pantothenate kinase